MISLLRLTMYPNQYWVMNLCLCLILNMCTIQSISYFIKDREVPSYLYRKFEVVEEEQFPSDIRIDVALSSVVGTLVYSIDRNMNQFIVTLRDDVHMDTRFGLEVELNNQLEIFSFSKLCAPPYGTFNVLDDFRIHIQINDYITIRCNGGKSERFRNRRQRKIHDNYPIMFSESDQVQGQKNAAHLWLVNHPIVGKALPNYYQMYGCIYNVFYKDEPIEFTNVSSNVVPNCKKTCQSNLCNGGDCFVIYSTETICNCTTAFLNGRLCSDEMKTQNIRATSQSIMTKIFKLSWRSNSSEIMELKNNFVRIAVTRQGSNLSFEYEYTDHRNKNIKILLSDDFIPNKNSICVAYFYKDHADIRVYNNDVWKTVNFPCESNFGDETFHTIVLRSEKGVIDMVTKYYIHYQWDGLYITNPINIMNLIEDPPKSYTTVIAVSVAVPYIILVIGLSVWQYCLYKWKQRYKYLVSTTDKYIELPYIERNEQYVKMKKEHEYIHPGKISMIVDRIEERIKRNNEVIHSPCFYSHENGYKVRLRVYPGGNRNPTRMAVFIQICKSDNDDNLSWPCRHSFNISIVNIRNNRIHNTMSCGYGDNDDRHRNCYNKPTSEYNIAVGYESFISHRNLRSIEGIIVNDCIILKCVSTPPLL